MATATYYCRWDVSPGSGLGTIASPWNVADVLVSGNPKSLPSHCAVALMTDGVNKYTISADLLLPVAYMSVYPCSTSGGATPTLAVVDGGGFAFTSGKCLVVGMESRNAPYAAFSSSGGDYLAVLGCVARSPTGAGISMPGGARSTLAYGCQVIDAGGSGIEVSEANYQGGVFDCYVENAASFGLIGYRLAGNIVIATPGTGAKAPIRYNAGINGSFCAHNTVFCTAPAVSTYNLYGISISAAYGQNALLDNLVVGAKNTGTASAYAFGYTNATALPGCNLGTWWDCDAATYNGPAALETLTNADPGFVSASDLRPANDLTAYSMVKTLGAEGLTWRDPGALSHVLAGGGGGGGGGGGRRPMPRRHGV